MKYLYFCLILSFLILKSFGENSFKTDQVDNGLMKNQTKWAFNLIQSRHYIHQEINELEGAPIIEKYIESFDYLKLYFLQSDIDAYLLRFADSVEAFLEKGNLYPAFIIYEDYKEKVEARTNWIFQKLEQPFSFGENEFFESDRSEKTWPKNAEQADTLWNKYLEYQLLNELLSLSAEAFESEDSDTSPETQEALSNQLEQLIKNPDFYKENMEAAIKKIKRRFERNLNTFKDREHSDLQEYFINATTHLFDPHSSFLSTHTLESFNSSVKNSFVGIGALLEDVDGICTIKDILPGGPAERSKSLSAEDEILGVAQGDDAFEDVVDMQLKYIVRKIKGAKGTTVRLLIRPGETSDPSARKIVSLRRDEVKLTANLASARIFSLPVNDSFISVGVIELPSFYGNIGINNALATTTEDVQELIEKLKAQNIEGLILDLRNNGGGLLSEAVRLAGLFIPVGPVVQVVDAKERKQVLHDQNPNISWSGPLIVLTSRFSASASEIVAGALKDHERALIIGDSSTHGKGTVQEVFHMNNRMDFNWFQNYQTYTPPVASKITVKQFFLPQGSSTQLKGVPSDIILPSINEILPIGESDLDNAIPWKKIKPVNWYNNWEKINVASPYQKDLIPYLAQKSQSRQNSLEEFTYLNDQINWRKKRYDETSISLNLETRIEEQIDARIITERLKERHEALKEVPYTQSDILLNIREEQEALSEDLKSQTSENDAVAVAVTVETTSAHSTATAIADNGDDNGDGESSEADEETDEFFFDIHLRETTRIMRDWVLWQNGNFARSESGALFPSTNN